MKKLLAVIFLLLLSGCQRVSFLYVMNSFDNDINLRVTFHRNKEYQLILKSCKLTYIGVARGEAYEVKKIIVNKNKEVIHYLNRQRVQEMIRKQDILREQKLNNFFPAWIFGKNGLNIVWLKKDSFIGKNALNLSLGPEYDPSKCSEGMIFVK